MSNRLHGGSAVALGLLVLMASGCAPLLERLGLPPAGQPAAEPAPAGPPPPPADLKPFTPPAVKPAPAKPTPPPKPGASLSLPELVGMSEEEVARLLGTADTLREEPPATVWGYQAGTCALDLFFYMDVESRNFRALAYDVSTSDGVKGDAALNACLKQIMDRRR